MLAEAIDLVIEAQKEFPWHRGKPPHVGWWYTYRLDAENQEVPVISYMSGCWRWWNGKAWSVIVSHQLPAEVAANRAKIITEAPHVLWCYYWPKKARVPRLDEAGFETFTTDKKTILAPGQKMLHRCCTCGSVHELDIQAVSSRDYTPLPVVRTISARRIL